tara:strand:+ start:405 stop:692 length:288 start_codon:yes stop_codon:yes gene_type:complete
MREIIHQTTPYCLYAVVVAVIWLVADRLTVTVYLPAVYALYVRCEGIGGTAELAKDSLTGRIYQELRRTRGRICLQEGSDSLYTWHNTFPLRVYP